MEKEEASAGDKDNGDATQLCSDNVNQRKQTSSLQKRMDYLSWDEYFMGVAFLSSQRSKDPKTQAKRLQVGACIVNKENKIVSTGYNGMPIGCSDDVMPWGDNPDNIFESKHLYVCHAELNAVLNRNTGNLTDCRIYVSLFPCPDCAKVIIQSGIKEVVYFSEKKKHKYQVSRQMFNIAGVRLRQYQPERKQIVINFGTDALSTRAETDHDQLCNK